MIVNRLMTFPQKYNVNGKSSTEFEKQCLLIAKGNMSGFQLALQAIADITLAVVEVKTTDDCSTPNQVIEPLRMSEEGI